MLAVIYTTGFKPFFSRASPETEKHGVLYRNKFQEKHDEESTATKGYSIFDPYFCSAFAVNLLIQKLFTTQTLVPMIFVFGVFLISLKTHGYCYGITSAIVSVFAVNFAFTYPYYVFDFFVGESILSAVIMLAVAFSPVR